MPTTVAVFTRDLRVRDNPMLTCAVRDADRVVPLFVLDDRITKAGFANPGRTRFLAESLADLDQTLRHHGGRLVVRTGEPVEEICRVAEQVNAARVHIAADASAYAQARQSALWSALQGQRRELCCHEDVHTVVAPGTVVPQGRDHFVVFTPYHRRWSETAWRQSASTPERIQLPDIEPGTLPVVAFQWLLDGDIANNCLNWQWVAGTGTDSRPNRVLNPLRQAQRYDPDGAYVRRYVPELAHLDSANIHQP